jgi:hypothetical protein
MLPRRRGARPRRSAWTSRARRAKRADTAAAWQQYLADHPGGACVEQARARLAELEAASKPPPAPPPVTPTPEAEPATELSPLVWVGVALAGAGAITWGVAGGLLIGKSSELDAQCPNQRCPDAEQDALDSAKLTAHVSTVGVVVTGVGVAVGVVGLLWPYLAPAPNEESTPGSTTETTARVEPWVGPAFGGVRGVF